MPSRRVPIAACIGLAAISCSDARERELEPSPKSDVQTVAACVPRPRAWPFTEPMHSIGGLLFNEIAIHPDGSIAWNSSEVDLRRLQEYVNTMAEFHPVVHVVLQTAPESPCRLVEQVRSMMDNSEVCRRGGCVEARRWEALGYPSFEAHRDRFADVEKGSR